MIISAIVARAKNNVIGIDNKLPWHLPGDLRFFREKTMGRHVIMGRKSFDSLPGPLKGRTIITVTHNNDYYDSTCIVRHSIPQALLYAKQQGENEVMILGGGIIYAETQNLWDKMYITDVDVEVKGDTTFVELDYDRWLLDQQEHHKADSKNKYNYTFRTYTRIK
jgi:dihydrofolate reductase